MTQDPGGTDDITQETWVMVARVRERATRVPLGADLGSLAVDAALAPVRDMTPDEIRRLGATAVDQARQISFLLGKLAGLLDDEHEERP